MDRLTQRDEKGRAYFDDDGALVRGVNGAFRQKKDMTGRFIHQRFVALDKAIDRLAAYEDTGLTPEEITDLQRAWDMYGGEEGITALLTEPPNDPLTLEELRGDGRGAGVVDNELRRGTMGVCGNRSRGICLI